MGGNADPRYGLEALLPQLFGFGAPIDDADAKAIADYLKKNYGS